MIITTTDNGKHYGHVGENGRVVFTTPGYMTEGMALAAARCWEAFHGEGAKMSETVWVPVGRGEEIELPYGDVTKIAIDFQAVRDAQRGGDQYKSHRMLRTLEKWARETHALDTTDLAAISRWWWEVDSKARAERGRQAVEMIKRMRLA